MREPGDQGVDVAVDALQADHLIGDPVDRQPAAVGELDEDGLQQVEMRIGQRLAKIRDLAHRPGPYAGRGAGAIAHGRAAGEHLQTAIERVARAQQAARGRLGIQRLQQVLERGEVERGIAPAHCLSAEIVTFDRFDRPGVEAAHLGRGAERAIRMCRPARPAICPISCACRRRRSRPSNLTRLAKAT